jgi:hypothetical protein
MTAPSTAARTAPKTAPEPKREAFKNDRLTFLEHATGGIRRVVMPDGISLAEFLEHANSYLSGYGRLILPGSLLVVVDETNTRMGFYYVRSAIDGYGALNAVDLLPMFQWEDASAAAEPLQPTDKDNYVARYSNLYGYFVVNSRTGAIKYQGLSGLDEATRLASQLMQNRARS